MKNKKIILSLIMSIIALLVAIAGMLLTLKFENDRAMADENVPTIGSEVETEATLPETIPTEAPNANTGNNDQTTENDAVVEEPEVEKTEPVDTTPVEDATNSTEEPTDASEPVNGDEVEEDVKENEEPANVNAEPGDECVIYVTELEPYVESNYPDDGAIIYTTGEVNVRAKPSMGGKIIGKLEKDARIFRYDSANGWSRILYNGEIAYIADRYVNSIKIEPFDLYEETDEVVYAGYDVNMRLVPSTYGPSAGKLKQGESARRIGIGKNGWSQVMYKNQLFYINSRYLSVEPDFKIHYSTFLEDDLAGDDLEDLETTIPATEPIDVGSDEKSDS